jgi:hypothetical protein
MKICISDVKWPFSREQLDCMQEQLNYKYSATSDLFVLGIIYPYYKNIKRNFYNQCIEADPKIKEFIYKNIEYDVYLEYKGRALYIDPENSHSFTEYIQYPISEEYDCVKKFYGQLEKIESDLQYLTLWARPSFKQFYDRKVYSVFLDLQKYISPMFLKSNVSLSMLLEDLDRYERPKDNQTLQRAEDILSFYVGFNLVCSI